MGRAAFGLSCALGTSLMLWRRTGHRWGCSVLTVCQRRWASSPACGSLGVRGSRDKRTDSGAVESSPVHCGTPGWAALWHRTLGTLYGASEFKGDTALEPERWRAAIAQAWWYRQSSFAYCAVGLCTLLRSGPGAPLRAHDSAWFPWRVPGAAALGVGFTSYMADTVTFGQEPPSRWLAADRVVATSLYLSGMSMVGCQVAGLFSFPNSLTLFFTLSLLGGLWGSSAWWGRSDARVPRAACPRLPALSPHDPRVRARCRSTGPSVLPTTCNRLPLSPPLPLNRPVRERRPTVQAAQCRCAVGQPRAELSALAHRLARVDTRRLLDLARLARDAEVRSVDWTRLVGIHPEGAVSASWKCLPL